MKTLSTVVSALAEHSPEPEALAQRIEELAEQVETEELPYPISDEEIALTKKMLLAFCRMVREARE